MLLLASNNHVKTIANALDKCEGMKYTKQMAYTVELREKALTALRKGHSKKHVNEMYGLGINTLKSCPLRRAKGARLGRAAV